MPNNHREHLSAKQPQRIEALMARHAELERQIHRELQRPAMSETLIRELKARKLRLKDEIQEVHSGTSG
ncbi:MAG: YdcH family protein [Alphaproteobacteria bacterium]|nr:YdcH family protein [Alphaproteobacteria bacterium]MBU0858319.1 YdcH family protein [Alphaproteobacteria bacterium]